MDITLERHSLPPHSQTRFAFGDGKRTATSWDTPRQNQLLAALTPGEYERLLPHLEPVSLPLGWIIHGAGEREEYLYFLIAGIVSRFYVTENGATAESAVTGREGVIGVATFLSGQSTTSQAVVLSAGHAYRIKVAALSAEFERCGMLQRLLLRYTQALITQIAQTVACNRHHPLEQRLCCWILSCLDRLPSNKVAMTQELIASMLGVRREGVTEAAGHLQAAGLIHISRGHITVLNRPKLEARVCECYAVVKREHMRLLPRFTAT